jgi:catechol 2,3-dioxygenase-like lactoylglutathione lyase family enzyme
MRLNRCLIALAASLSPASLGAEPPKAPPAPFLEHVGIYVSDTQKTARFFTDVMGLRVNTVWWAVQPDAKGLGGLKLSFVDGNGMQFTLIEPTSPGPAADDIARLGDGALAELDYEVPDFDAEYDFHQRNGIRFVSMGGVPFPEGQKGWTVEPYGLRLVYLPQSVTHGIVTELYQRGPAATDILEKRDQGWKSLPPIAPDAPRLVRTLVLVQDLDRSSAFMAHVLRLPLIERLKVSNGMSCARFDSGKGSEVELVQPRAGSPLAAQLHAMGDGYLAGLLYQSMNPDDMRQRLRAKGIRLLGTSEAEAMALTPGCLDEARQTDWVAIHPKDSTGIRITMVLGSLKP